MKIFIAFLDHSNRQRKSMNFKTASRVLTAFYHNREEGRKKIRFLTEANQTSNSRLEVLLKAVERRDVCTVLNCLDEDCDIINENITVGSNIAALCKPWSQFILGIYYFLHHNTDIY